VVAAGLGEGLRVCDGDTAGEEDAATVGEGDAAATLEASSFGANTASRMISSQKAPKIPEMIGCRRIHPRNRYPMDDPFRPRAMRAPPGWWIVCVMQDAQYR